MIEGSFVLPMGEHLLLLSMVAFVLMEESHWQDPSLHRCNVGADSGSVHQILLGICLEIPLELHILWMFVPFR